MVIIFNNSFLIEFYFFQKFKASTYGFKDIVSLLLDNGADFNIANRDGNTALILGYKYL